MWSGTRENRYEVTGPLPPQWPGPDTHAGVRSRHRRERHSVSTQVIIYYNFRTEARRCSEVFLIILFGKIGVLDQDDV